MTRNEDGGVTLKMPVFIAIISACLAVGSGGTWFASAHESEVLALKDSVTAHHELSASVNSRQDVEIQFLKEQLSKMDKKLDETNQKLDRLLARR